MIALTAEKAHGDYDPGTSKLLGAPTMPEEWLTDGTVGEADFFFCQLRAEEYRAYDRQALLPEKGFLYFFLRKENDTWIPNCRYCEAEPDALIDDCNCGFDLPYDLETEYSLDFSDTADTDETVLLRTDSLPFCMQDEIVLLQYDPLDDGMPDFLADTEKVAYFLIRRADLQKRDFSAVRFVLA